ncbi:MAG: hypothetical protein AAF560_18095 [Acidobacteriota bacterium]
MPVHIGEISSEVTAMDDEVPLSDKQQDRIVERVLRRLQDIERHRALLHDTTDVRISSGKAGPFRRFVPRTTINRP